MREIKFRVRDLEEDKFIDLSDLIITFDNSGVEIYKNCGMTLDNYELNQYTGIKDVNDKEIYEGDIVEYTDGNFIRRIGLITFQCYGFMLNEIKGSQLDFLGTIDDIEEFAFKIIGTIYENSNR